MFRKKAGAWPVFLVLALLLSLLVLPAQAAEEAIGVTINGTPVTYDDGYGRPFVDAAGRTQVPFRLTMETFGCTVDWDNDTRTAVAEKDGTLSPLLRSIVWADGSRHGAFAAMLHSVWMGVLALGVLAPLAYRESGKREGECVSAAMMLSLIGITLFETIFEARARYLFIYAPVYLTVGMMGLRAAAERMKKKEKSA